MSTPAQPSAPPAGNPAQPTQSLKPAAVPPVSAISEPPRKALDPTRYGDWEKNGRCIDF
ncbi:MAG: DUF1674 domain-containing protein [Metallibacterium scheffleri]|jgi:hypothetical protein|uniref:DUF1674 domain-containing protein n=1 Tax=Metallibacterium sp. TaxID=2940281 RepID=UPI0026294BB3|nr:MULTISPECIES: DUF1674 domain-containing protein [Metallibacterium]MBW8073845.1 DUF1674 domain-containing protein [Metallibacterium scheffleri]